jgi:hypothetical protein
LPEEMRTSKEARELASDGCVTQVHVIRLLDQKSSLPLAAE